MEPDEPLFPRLDRKKTWLMVKKDLERIGIPYETPEGIADFHAAGRHSHITGLVRHGATLVEAKELARHADVRQTMKYTHIGLEDQAQALSGLPAPFASAARDGLHYGCISGGVLSQELSPGDTARATSRQPGNEQAPAMPGFASSLVTNCQQLTVCEKMEAAGIAPASPFEEHLIYYGLRETLEVSRAVTLQRIDTLVRVVLPSARQLTASRAYPPPEKMKPEVALS
jgi:hypothetical protein